MATASAPTETAEKGAGRASAGIEHELCDLREENRQLRDLVIALSKLVIRNVAERR